MSAKRVSPSLREAYTKILDAYADIDGVRSAVLLSADGFELATYGADAELRARLAAIASSLTALGVAITNEAGLNEFDRALFESGDGTILIVRVGNDKALSLVIVADKRITVGRTFWTAQHCSSALARVGGH